MHFVTRSSYRMQKPKFGVTCPDALFVKSILVPTEHENGESMFDAPECTM
jgi:hypothetical protein